MSDDTEPGDDITAKAPTARVKAIKFTTNATTSLLTVTSVTSNLYGNFPVGLDKNYATTTITIPVSDLFAAFELPDKTDFSVKTLRIMFGDTLIINGSLAGTGANSGLAANTTPITLKLKDPAIVEDFSSMFAKDTVGNTTTLTVQAGSINTAVFGLDFMGILKWAANGTTPAEISTDGTVYYSSSSDKTEVLDVMTLLLILFGDKTLGELDGSDLYYKLTPGGTAHRVVFAVP